MAVVHFTDLTVQNLKPGIYFDDRTPAFGIRVGKVRKTWLVLKEPNRTKVRLGHYPSLTLAEARKRALIALATPFQSATSPAFLEARRAFLALDRWKPRAHYEIKRTLTRHFHWTKSLDKITHTDVAAVIDAIEAKHEASHALKDIKTFFSWCVPRYIPHSPCAGLKAPARYEPRDRLLTDDEIGRIWRAAEQMGGYGRQVKLLIATGQRANQIIKLQPSWIDREQRLITFPASVMKHNRKHIIPYPGLIDSLLDGDRPTSYQGKKKEELDELSGVTGYVLHDFRRYFSSTHARLKTPIDITEALLAHLSGSRSDIQRIYDRHDRLEEMRDAVDRYEAWITKLVH
jgi:integrase